MGEKVLMKGNEAIGEAAIRSGCRHFFGYPITPQTELSAYMAKKIWLQTTGRSGKSQTNPFFAAKGFSC